MPKLNKLFTDYGCNKGGLIFIMDGINVYHNDMEQRYKDSLGGVFPMVCVQDNLGSLQKWEEDFQGNTPIYGLVSPSKQILYNGQSSTDFIAAIEKLNLKKQPELCDGVTGMIEDIKYALRSSKSAVSVIVAHSSSIQLQIQRSGEYSFTLYSLDGRCIRQTRATLYNEGRQVLPWLGKRIGCGGYTLVIEQNGLKQTQKIVIVE